MNNRRVFVGEYPNTENLLVHGILAGIVGAIAFAVSEMVLSAAILHQPFIEPLRVFASIVAGKQAMQPTYPLNTAGVIGGLVLLVLSIINGVIFIYLLYFLKQLRAPNILLLAYGWLYGLVLYALNFLFIASLFFSQFSRLSEFWNGFFSLTFVFGIVLGAYVAAFCPKP